MSTLRVIWYHFHSDTTTFTHPSPHADLKFQEPSVAVTCVSSLAIARARHSGRFHGHGAYSRAQLAKYVRIKLPSVLNRCDSGEQEPRHDTPIMQCEHKPPTASSSGNSRSVAFYATERRSLEHKSNHISKLHHANKLATLLTTTDQLAATICTICSHIAAKSCESTLRGKCQLQQQSQGRL